MNNKVKTNLFIAIKLLVFIVILASIGVYSLYPHFIKSEELGYSKVHPDTWKNDLEDSINNTSPDKYLLMRVIRIETHKANDPGNKYGYNWVGNLRNDLSSHCNEVYEITHDVIGKDKYIHYLCYRINDDYYITELTPKDQRDIAVLMVNSGYFEAKNMVNNVMYSRQFVDTNQDKDYVAIEYFKGVVVDNTSERKPIISSVKQYFETHLKPKVFKPEYKVVAWPWLADIH